MKQRSLNDLLAFADDSIEGTEQVLHITGRKITMISYARPPPFLRCTGFPWVVLAIATVNRELVFGASMLELHRL